jgi:ribosomal protein L2
MCNFIIRPIKCYATVGIVSTNGESESANDIKAGEELTVSKVVDGKVCLVRQSDAVVYVPMETFVHTFSDKKPEAEKQKAKESKEPKKD